MKVALVTPTAPDSRHGNGVTARRWAEMLGELGHGVAVSEREPAEDADICLALHARKSATAVRAFHAARPDAPIVIALTGTDLYPDLAGAGVDPEVLALASRLVVLQRRGLDQLPDVLRERTRVILQSAPPVPHRSSLPDCFEVAFLAHVRAVKDPMRLPAAVRRLRPTSRIRVTHVGEAREEGLSASLAAESSDNPRYTWLGPRPREEALHVLARSRLLALTSLHEGGANVASEALVAATPIVSSRIPGSVGLLGEDYPGYYPAGDTDALAALLDAVERDVGGLHRRLRERCAELAPLVDPAGERAALRALLAELAGTATTPA